MTDDEIITLAEQATERLRNACFRAAERAAQRVSEARKSVPEMLGEYLREASVLIIIFVPVEILLPQLMLGQSVNKAVLRWTIGLSVCTLVAGILLEKWRMR